MGFKLVFYTLTPFQLAAIGTLNVTQKIKFVHHRVENIMGKGENADFQHVLLSPQCFQKAVSPGTSKSSLCS